MEDALVLLATMILTKIYKVLILVLMEDALVPKGLLTTNLGTKKS